MATEFDPATEDPSPWSGKGFLVSAAVLGVIVALAVLLVVSNLLIGSPQPQTAADGDAVVSGQPADPAAAVESDSVCGLPDVQLTGTVDSPPMAEWTLLGTMAVPQRAGVGPGVVEDDGFRYCYAHTPEGALFAVANLVGMGDRDLLGEKIASRSVAAGPGREAAIADEADGSSTRGNDLRLQIAGFRVLSYTGDRATLDLAFQLNTGASAAWALDVVWQDGDWKIQVTDDGQPTSLPTRIPDLSGYILWGGA